jgi:hypothetical protein
MIRYVICHTGHTHNYRHDMIAKTRFPPAGHTKNLISTTFMQISEHISIYIFFIISDFFCRFASKNDRFGRGKTSFLLAICDMYIKALYLCVSHADSPCIHNNNIHIYTHIMVLYIIIVL